MTLLLAANGALVHGVDPAQLAAGVIALAGARPVAEQVEATERALEIVLRKLSTSGLDDPPGYFATVIERLFAPGGLEASRAARTPRTTEQPGQVGDDAYELLRKPAHGGDS